MAHYSFTIGTDDTVWEEKQKLGRRIGTPFCTFRLCPGKKSSVSKEEKHVPEGTRHCPDCHKPLEWVKKGKPKSIYH